jgi:hypothetical protein
MPGKKGGSKGGKKAAAKPAPVKEDPLYPNAPRNYRIGGDIRYATRGTRE